MDGGGTTAAEAVERLLAAQIALRNSRRLATAMRSSRLPAIKTLADFDFSFQPSVKREQIDSLHEIGFLERKENVAWRSASRSRRPRAGARSTSALSPTWSTPLMAAALLDRLLHRCHMVNIRGNSYRMRRHADLSRAIQPTASRAVSADTAGNGEAGS